jgi:hypothetical protein
MRAGRRRQLRHRALGAGGGAAVAAAAVVLGLTVAGGESSSAPAPAPADRTAQETTPDFDAHSMPAILKEAALSPLDQLPDWTSFRIDAQRDTSGGQPLNQANWDLARVWTLDGVADDGQLSLKVAADDPTARGVPPEVVCASPPHGLASTCEHTTLPDGRALVQYWMPTTVPSEADPLNAGRWYTRVVKVYSEDTGYSVEVRAGAPAPSPDAAARKLWLPPEELVDIATSTIVLLEGPR